MNLLAKIDSKSAHIGILGLGYVGLPLVIEFRRAGFNVKSVWAQYSLLAKTEQERSSLQKKLQGKGIPTAIYYPKSLHLQTASAYLPILDIKKATFQ